MPDQSLKVSIITPTYNRADFLPVAIESVQAQSLPDWEMLIVDDGSTDNTAELVNRYSAQDSRIRYFQQPNQ
jgi:glycosyltransferase involved in cell wall biosynthesis